MASLLRAPVILSNLTAGLARLANCIRVVLILCNLDVRLARLAGLLRVALILCHLCNLVVGLHRLAGLLGVALVLCMLVWQGWLNCSALIPCNLDARLPGKISPAGVAGKGS